jgi:hypothetical protein
METTTHEVSTRPRAFDVVATIVVAFNLAFVQPLLGLLGGSPAFFVAHNTTGTDLIALATLFAIVIPIVGAVVVLLLGRLSARLGRIAWLLVLGGSVGLFIIQLLRRTALPGWLSLAIAFLLGLLAARAISNTDVLRRICRILSPVALAIGLLFLFASPASALLRPSSGSVAGARITKPTPIVFAILDEFPVASLMDEHGAIDEDLFPAFAGLAAEGTWYRRATSVADFTDKAVPAILTGRRPNNRKAPTVSDYPDNLFTLLGSHGYDVEAMESVTKLCPDVFCAPAEGERAFKRRWKWLLSDIRFVGLRMLLPKDVATGLPDVSQGWGDFGKRGDKAESTRGKDRKQLWHEFVQHAVGTTGSQRIAYHHAQLPHPAWQFLPDGHKYHQTGAKPGQAQGRPWVGDQWLADLAYQRHLLQVGFTDRMVGELVSALKNAGTYDETLIVVTSDHGAAFDADLSRRAGITETMGGIGAPPLFIKYPGQNKGVIEDRRATSIDILPTIADVLGIDGMFSMDGRSLLGPPVDEPQVMLTARGRSFPVDPEMRFAEAQRKYGMFAHAGNTINLYAMGPFASLVGTKASQVGTLPGATVMVDSPGFYRSWDPALEPTHTLLTGRIRVPSGFGTKRYIAISVNGVIQGVGRTIEPKGDMVGIETMLPFNAFRKGANDLRFFLVDGGRLADELRTT